METKSNAKLKAMFIIPSITGIILFMIPVKNAAGEWTVVVKILADIISGAIGGFLPLLCVLILTVSAVMSVIALAKPKFIMNSDIMKECFACKPIWVVLRVLAVIFVWLTYLGVGEDGVGLIGMITGGGQGGFVLYDLLTTLVIIFVIAALLLPLLLDFGLLEFVGALLTKVMRPPSRFPAVLQSTASPPGSATVRWALCSPATSMKAAITPPRKRASSQRCSPPFPSPLPSSFSIRSVCLTSSASTT